MQLEALCLLLPLVVCLIYREDPKPFLYTIGLVGLLVHWCHKQVDRQE